MEQQKSVFEVLSAIDCSAHVEKKNGLDYLTWAWAWHYVKKNYPTAYYTIYEDARGFNYFTDGRTCWVKTGVTIEGQEHIEYLPVMDYKNNSITIDKVTSTDINKSIQRSLTKACARHGLGLYIYAGEDLPEDADQAKPAPAKKAAAKPAAQPAPAPAPAPAPQPAPAAATKQLSEAEADHIIKMIYACRSREDVNTLWNTYKDYRNHPRVKAAFQAAGNMYPKEGGKQ